ncbi:MAG: peptidoglycan DD-metalloendopeptidase family protein [Deltaproteobacteria bacterium]|nr:peptidoglycan DD-metalloendopeptidase family protein [Deltaproteobacteria bacterium]
MTTRAAVALRLIVIAAIICVCAGDALTQPAPTPIPTTESLDAWRARVNAAIKAETSVLREIYRVESSEFQALRQLQVAEQQIANIETRLAESEREMAYLDTEADRLRRLLGVRLRYMNRLGRANLARMLFESETISIFLRRWRGIKFVVENDRRLTMSYRLRRDELRHHQDRMFEDRRQLESLRVQRQTSTLEAQLERQKRMILLDEIRRDRAISERAGRELDQIREENEPMLTRELTPGEGGPPAGPADAGGPLILDFATLRGYLKRPVAGPVVRGFGPIRNEALGTVTRSNGIDILASEGTPVIAAADGSVRYAGEFLGYGRVVIIDHGDRYHTMYGHLDRVLCEKGQVVRGGAAIGTVGATGSLSGPQLHFEIRYKGVAVDPMPWFGTAP